jgi:hypothetical protein
MAEDSSQRGSSPGVLFAGWVIVVSIACIDTAYSWPPIFGSIVLPVALMAWQPKGEFTRAISGKDRWLALCTIFVLLGLLLYGALSGSTKASNDWWHERPQLRVYASACTWLLFMYSGYRAFRAKHFSKSSSTAHPTTGT